MGDMQNANAVGTVCPVERTCLRWLVALCPYGGSPYDVVAGSGKLGVWRALLCSWTLGLQHNMRQWRRSLVWRSTDFFWQRPFSFCCILLLKRPRKGTIKLDMMPYSLVLEWATWNLKTWWVLALKEARTNLSSKSFMIGNLELVTTYSGVDETWIRLNVSSFKHYCLLIY